MCRQIFQRVGAGALALVEVADEDNWMCEGVASAAQDASKCGQVEPSSTYDEVMPGKVKR